MNQADVEMYKLFRNKLDKDEIVMITDMDERGVLNELVGVSFKLAYFDYEDIFDYKEYGESHEVSFNKFAETYEVAE